MARFAPDEQALKLHIQSGFEEELQELVNEAKARDQKELGADDEYVSSADGTPNFYDYWDIFPEELREIKANVAVIAEEALRVAQNPWIPWPEDSLNSGNAQDWTVFPFLHTFPALDESRSRWISSTMAACPQTAALLKGVPNIRTALFSRLDAHTELKSHTGWSDLANYVLRVHVCLSIPALETCGLWVNGEIKYHAPGEVIVFDDSKSHMAFNNSDTERIVLIFDILRPLDVPLGTCIGGHTAELDGLMKKFG
jgi:aspartyl/asparaginyl beta-hydroxylase (cupin superfamily)